MTDQITTPQASELRVVDGVTLPAAGTYVLDPGHTRIGFVARHLMVTKVRGAFREFEGSITVGEDIASSTATATIQTASIDTGVPDRDKHLRSGDFFEIEKFPAMTYRSSGIRQVGDEYVLDGELTIKDVTRPVPLTFELNGFSADPWGGTRIGLSAKGEINRRDFNVNFEGVNNGLAVVADKIELVIDVEATLRQPAAE